MNACPCGSRQTYEACCSRWHAGLPAPTAETLMRSRYSAFVLKQERYLLDSWHPSTRPPTIAFIAHQKWLGLEIVDRAATSDDTAEVEFIARYRIGGGSAARLHERSRFVKEHGQWLYVDGDIRRS